MLGMRERQGSIIPAAPTYVHNGGIVMSRHCMHVHGCVVQLCTGEFTEVTPI